MEEEIKLLQKNETYVLQKERDNINVRDFKQLSDKKKTNISGKEKYKARLGVKGFIQKKGVDYDETFALVVTYESIRILVALSVKLDLENCLI